MNKVICNNGNIPIDDNLFNKYKNVREIFDNVECNYIKNIDINDNIKELENINLSKMTKTDIYHKATEIFSNYHKSNEIINNNNKIIVSNSDIKESINKINNYSLQRRYIKEHLLIFSFLGNIIENATLVNQTLESKNRESNIFWNYYLCFLSINGEIFLFQFDVISKSNGENHYRIQRIKKANAPAESVNSNTASALETSAFSGNNIS